MQAKKNGVECLMCWKKKKKTSSLETVSSEVILKKLRWNTFSNKQKNEEFIASKPTLLRNAKKKSFREK